MSLKDLQVPVNDAPRLKIATGDFNENHDERGKFASNGSSAQAAKSAATSAAHAAAAKYHAAKAEMLKASGAKKNEVDLHKWASENHDRAAKTGIMLHANQARLMSKEAERVSAIAEGVRAKK